MNPSHTHDGFPTSSKALIEFSSHSSARKAVMVAKHDSIKCCWAPAGLLELNQVLDKAPIQLVKGGPCVDITFAQVHPEIIHVEWPKILLGCGQTPLVPGEPAPLMLPIPKTWDGERQGVRPRSIELDMSDILNVNDMDWCMNTPSPVRHMACLI